MLALTHLEQPLGIREALKGHFGFDDFRPGQADVVHSVLSGTNTVVVMPTGAGKSLCFQLPGLLLEGLTLVVSPLIALMQDQVEALQARGIAATLINSTLSDTERQDRIRRMRGGEYKLVYVAPERLRSDSFLQAVLQANLSLFAIDEAHCISQWGHDFRPDYAQLGQVRKKLRPPRTVALTATATPEVRDDIVRVLLMKEPRVFVAGFDRPNLFLEVLSVGGDDDKRRACEALAADGSGVVYCSTRKQAEGLHTSLLRAKVDAVLYHAGMDDEARRSAQTGFMERAGAVAVATNAFGMGIDKPDIRWVAHAGIPRAVEAYYQEIGRAGRDGKPARAALLFNHADVFTQERLIQNNHPPEALFADVWNALRHTESYDGGVQRLALQVGASDFELSAVLKHLERFGKLTRSSRGEGRYGVSMTQGAGALQPRSPEARALLVALLEAFPPGATGSTELPVLARRSGLDEERVKHALGLLERAGAVVVRRPFAGRAIAVHDSAPWSALGVDLGKVRAQERNNLLLLKRMTDYAYAKRCRRAYLLRYFGDHSAQPNCGACDVCVGARLKLASATSSAPRAAPSLSPHASLTYSELAAEELKRWRKELAKDLDIPPYIIFNDATLYGLAAALPTSEEEFLAVKGTGPARWERFGVKVTELCLLARAAGGVPQPAPARRRRR